MVSVLSLWLPILVSGVVVFLVSFVLHMVLTYHHSNHRKLPEEDAVMEALRKFDISPGDYMMPCGGGPKAMKDPAFIEKMSKGPVIVFTVLRKGSFNMGPSLAQWFVYSLVVGAFAAYVAGRAVPPGGDYLAVFRFAGCTAFAGYTLSLWQDTIWYKRSWTTSLKYTFDGLVYALCTAGVFGAMWPGA